MSLETPALRFTLGPSLCSLRRLARCTRGQNGVEYVVVLGLVALAAAVGYTRFGDSLQGAVATDTRHVATLTGGKAGGAGGGSGGATGGTGTGSAAGDAPPGAVCTGDLCTREGNCFVAGTLIATADGPAPIETIGVGTRVDSEEAATGARAFEPVHAVFARQTSGLVDVVIASSDGAAPARVTTTTVRATPEHPFWSRTRGWVGAGDLRVGEPLEGRGGRDATATVVSVDVLPMSAVVYNLEVDVNHTYFAGEAEVLVHNTCATASATNGAAPSVVASAAPAPETHDGAHDGPHDDTSDTASFHSAYSDLDDDSDTASFYSAHSDFDDDDGSPPVPSPTVSLAGDPDPNAPTSPIDAVFLNELSSTPYKETAYKAWKYGGKTALTVVGHAVPGAAVITSPVAAGVDATAAAARYAHAYGKLQTRLDSLHDIRTSIPPGAEHDRARAATNYAISQTTRQLNAYYEGTMNTVGGAAVGQIPVVGPVISGVNSARTTIPQLAHTANKYKGGELSSERKAGARILLDEAYLNNSPHAQAVMKTFYGDKASAKIGGEWQKIHAAEGRMDASLSANGAPLPTSPQWKKQGEFVGKWGQVKPQRTEPAQPSLSRVGGAINSRITPPEKVTWTGDAAVLNRPAAPAPAPIKSRPIKEYPNDQITAELGARFQSPGTKLGKTKNAIHNTMSGIVPSMGYNGAPDKPIVEATKGRLSAVPKPLKKPKVRPTPAPRPTPIEAPTPIATPRPTPLPAQMPQPVEIASVPAP